MGNSAGHLSPGRHPLGLNHLSQIIEDGHHSKGPSLLILEVRQIDQEGERFPPQPNGQLFLNGILLGGPEFIQQLFHLGHIFLAQHFVEFLVQDIFPFDLQHLLSRSIDGCDDALIIDRNHPSRHIFQDDLHVFPSLFQFISAHLEISCHLIEGLDKHPDLVCRLHLNPEVKVSGRNPMGRLCHLFNGNCDVLGQIEPKPGGREDDEKGDHQERHHVARLNRLLQYLQLLVIHKGLRDLSHLGGQALGDEMGGGHHANDFLLL